MISLNLKCHNKTNGELICIFFSLKELLGVRSASPTQFRNLVGSSEAPVTSAPLGGRLHKGPSPPLFPQRAPSPEYYNSQLQPSAGKFTEECHRTRKKIGLAHKFIK